MAGNSDTSLNIAIIGYGAIAKERHQYAIPKNGAFFCCIIDPGIKESEVNGIRLFKTLEEAKNAGIRIDAVSICTPPNTHAEIAKDALNYGCHVLLEKPPVLNLNDLDELEELAREKGKTLFLAYHTASSPAVLKLQKILQDKKVIHIEANFSEEVTMWHDPKEWIFKKEISGGGITMDIGINAFSAICRTMPKAQIKLINCVLESEQNYRVDTQATIIFEDTVNGAKGQIKLNWFNGRDNKDIRRIKYQTNEGIFILDLSTARLYEELEGEEREIETDRDQEYEVIYKEFINHVKSGQSYIPKQELKFITEVYSRNDLDQENEVLVG